MNLCIFFIHCTQYLRCTFYETKYRKTKMKVLLCEFFFPSTRDSVLGRVVNVLVNIDSNMRKKHLFFEKRTILLLAICKLRQSDKEKTRTAWCTQISSLDFCNLSVAVFMNGIFWFLVFLKNSTLNHLSLHIFRLSMNISILENEKRLFIQSPTLCSNVIALNNGVCVHIWANLPDLQF